MIPGLFSYARLANCLFTGYVRLTGQQEGSYKIEFPDFRLLHKKYFVEDANFFPWSTQVLIF